MIIKSPLLIASRAYLQHYPLPPHLSDHCLLDLPHRRHLSSSTSAGFGRKGLVRSEEKQLTPGPAPTELTAARHCPCRPGDQLTLLLLVQQQTAPPVAEARRSLTLRRSPMRRGPGHAADAFPCSSKPCRECKSTTATMREPAFLVVMQVATRAGRS